MAKEEKKIAELMARSVEISQELDMYFGGHGKTGIIVAEGGTPFTALLHELAKINKELGY